MNIRQIQKAVADLSAKVGPEAYVSINILPTRISGSLYTKGVCQRADDASAFRVGSEGADPACIIAELETKWRAEESARRDRIIEQMALSIIRLTDEFSVCTDAALRAEYSPALVKELSAAAVERANSMASKGPFSIVSVASANAASNGGHTHETTYGLDCRAVWVCAGSLPSD